MNQVIDPQVWCSICQRYYRQSDNHRHPAAAYFPSPVLKEK